MPLGSPSPTPAQIDWNSIMARALSGDRAAYARLLRLVTGYLVQWRAYDFRADWEDMAQDVLVSTAAAYREGRLEDPGALTAYVRQATRFQFIDRIRAGKRRIDGKDPQESIERGKAEASWPPQGEGALSDASAEMKISLASAVEHLPERERVSVYEVYVRGRTYEEAAKTTGIPLGSLKRALHTGLAALRKALNDAQS